LLDRSLDSMFIHIVTADLIPIQFHRL